MNKVRIGYVRRPALIKMLELAASAGLASFRAWTSHSATLPAFDAIRPSIARSTARTDAGLRGVPGPAGRILAAAGVETAAGGRQAGRPRDAGEEGVGRGRPEHGSQGVRPRGDQGGPQWQPAPPQGPNRDMAATPSGPYPSI